MKSAMTKDTLEFALIPEDLREMGCGIPGCDEVPFFELERVLKEKVGFPLRKKKKRDHRWGMYVLLFKHKYWARIRSGEVW